VQDRAENVVALRVGGSGKIETAGSAGIVFRAGFKKTDVLQHRCISRPGRKLPGGGAKFRRA
jgi:hypothetical protein